MEIIITIGKYLLTGITSIILIIVIGIFLARWWLNRFLKKATGQDLSTLMAMSNSSFLPRIHLIQSDESWHKPDQIIPFLSQAKDLGFTSLGSYSVEEMDLLQMEIMTDPSQTIILAIYDHESLPDMFYDLHISYKNGGSDCLSTSKAPQNPRPAHIRTWQKVGIILDEGLAFLSENVRKEERIKVTETNIVSLFEESYAEEMDYLIHLNFVSEENIRHSGDMLDLDHSHVKDKDIQKTMNIQKLQYKEAIPEIAIEHFLKNSQLTATEWNQYSDDVLVVHERDDVELLWNQYFEYHFLPTEYDAKKKKAVSIPLITEREQQILKETREKLRHDPLKYFEKMNKVLPQKKQFNILGQVAYPVKAVLYYPKDNY